MSKITISVKARNNFPKEIRPISRNYPGCKRMSLSLSRVEILQIEQENDYFIPVVADSGFINCFDIIICSMNGALALAGYITRKVRRKIVTSSGSRDITLTPYRRCYCVGFKTTEISKKLRLAREYLCFADAQELLHYLKSEDDRFADAHFGEAGPLNARVNPTLIHFTGLPYTIDFAAELGANVCKCINIYKTEPQLPKKNIREKILKILNQTKSSTIIFILYSSYGAKYLIEYFNQIPLSNKHRSDLMGNSFIARKDGLGNDFLDNVNISYVADSYSDVGGNNHWFMNRPYYLCMSDKVALSLLENSRMYVVGLSKTLINKERIYVPLEKSAQGIENLIKSIVDKR